MKFYSYLPHIFITTFYLFAFSLPIHSINVNKLGLNQLRLKNKTQQPQTVKVTFWEKCEGCPRLHGTHTKTVTLNQNEKQTVSNKQHVIKNVELLDSSKHINFQLNKKGNVRAGVIQSKKDTTVNLKTEFDQEINDNNEYQMLRSGHEDHISSLPDGIKANDFFSKLSKLYNINNLEKKYSPSVTTQRAKISRIIHQIWFGTHPMPQQFKKWQLEWKDKHPNWIFIEWDEQRIKQKFPEGLVNQKIFDEARMMYDYATMSKVARYEVLNKFGGLYIDPDIKCYETFEPLHHIYDFYAGLGSSYKTFGIINNGIIGSRANHPILRAAIDHIKKSDAPLKTDHLNLYNWTARNLSMKPLTEAVWMKIGNSNFIDIIFPRSFFDCNKVKKEFNHTQPIYEAGYTNIKHNAETMCSRGAYSYQQ